MLKIKKNILSPKLFFLITCCLSFVFHFKIESAEVTLGIEQLFSPEYSHLIKGKKVGLITNHTAINSNGKLTETLLKENAQKYHYSLNALFAPEHGLLGLQYAEENVLKGIDSSGTPIFSLHGQTRRPTPEMLKDINLLIFDIQDIGSRSYTYCSTLFYSMEEAAKLNIPVLILDRPNPLGAIVDGPILEEKWRSFVGYLNVPYCHGLTIGELAQYFNAIYQVKCDLKVIPMKGWKRTMTFDETGLIWIPTSPHIPESETAFYYPTTGLLGELQLVNIGVGYTLPFKIVGAPWIDATSFAQKLNAQNYPGVYFHPFHFRPFFGRFAGKDCHGVLIVVKDAKNYLPVTTQYLIIGMLKSMYPKEFQSSLASSKNRQEMFNKVNGTDEIYHLIENERYLAWKLRSFHSKERSEYLIRRQPYLIQSYD